MGITYGHADPGDEWVGPKPEEGGEERNHFCIKVTFSLFYFDFKFKSKFKVGIKGQ